MKQKFTVTPLLLRRDDVCQLVGLSTSSIERLVARNEFPAPRKTSDRVVAWRREDVEHWVATRPVSDIATPNRGKR